MRPVSRSLPPSAPPQDGGSFKTPSARWNEGLELARACAVILVVYSHGQSLLGRESLWAWLSSSSGLASFFKPGWWGVRIFFALSGYLIGRQVIEILHHGQLRSALYFGYRRWIRTVPTYWIILGIVCIWKGVSWLSSTAIINALFLQSALPGQNSTELIEVAWSLVIEEWSYLLLTCLVVLFAFTGLKPTQCQAAKFIAYVSLASTAFSIAARFWAASSPWISWEILKKTSMLQLDSLAAGLCLASMEVLKPDLFKALTQKRLLMGATSIAAMSLIGWWINEDYSRHSTTTPMEWALLGAFGYPISGILSCGFLTWLWNVKISYWPPFLRRPIQLLSATSYSLYLVHLSVPLFLLTIWPDMNGMACFLLYMVISVGLGYVSWFLLEKPFLSLRRFLHVQKPEKMEQAIAP